MRPNSNNRLQAPRPSYETDFYFIYWGDPDTGFYHPYNRSQPYATVNAARGKLRALREEFEGAYEFVIIRRTIELPDSLLEAVITSREFAVIGKEGPK